MASSETRLADFVGTGWFLMDSHWSLHFRKNYVHDGHLFELSGNRMSSSIFRSSLPLW
ncbi:hypothetical protein I3843_09G051700 [Carya illinoinensis]|nr:hypothetical protein I3843_09G051700 [Carya illinoinensis]